MFETTDNRFKVYWLSRSVFATDPKKHCLGVFEGKYGYYLSNEITISMKIEAEMLKTEVIPKPSIYAWSK